MPTQVVSDNAKTFISAAQTLQDVLRSQEVQQYFSGMNIRWVFNLEKAPWWGGFFERLVQSVKRCLKKSVGRARLSFDELSTLLIEIETIINSRPLSYLSMEDLEEPLTPSHLLTGHRILSLPNVTAAADSTDEQFVMNSHELNTRVQHFTSVLEDYWTRWRDEYLLQLREQYSYVGSVGVNRSPVPGEVHDENHPRSFWKLGRVTDVIKGDDGQIRGAVIDVTNGKPQTLRRPITHLCPLEVMSEIKQSSTTNDQDDSTENVTVDDPVSRPVQAAAQRARQQVLEWTTDADDIDHM